MSDNKQKAWIEIAEILQKYNVTLQVYLHKETVLGNEGFFPKIVLVEVQKQNDNEDICKEQRRQD